MIGAAWATGGSGGGRANGAGLAIVAPGEPAPDISGAAAVACGAVVRLRTCAEASTGATQISAAAKTMLRRQIVIKPHPAMMFFSVAITAFSCPARCVKPLKLIGTFIIAAR